MVFKDKDRIRLPNGAEIARDDRETGRVYVVYGDPAIHDALPSATMVLETLPPDMPENGKLRVDIDQTLRQAQDEFRKRYLSNTGAPPDTAKPFSPLYAQAREWARQGAERQSIMKACMDLNRMYADPLDANMLNKMVEAAMTLGQSERYANYNLSAMALGDGTKSGAKQTDRHSMDKGLREYIIRDLSDERPSQPQPLLVQGVNAWHKWKEQADIVDVIAVRQPLYHTDGYAGEVDAILRLKDGGVTMLSWEISDHFHSKQALEIGAYARAWEYVSAQRTDKGIIVRLDRDTGEFAESPSVNLPRAWQRFEAALRFHQAYDTLHLAWFSQADFT